MWPFKTKVQEPEWSVPFRYSDPNSTDFTHAGDKVIAEGLGAPTPLLDVAKNVTETATQPYTRSLHRITMFMPTEHNHTPVRTWVNCTSLYWSGSSVQFIDDTGMSVILSGTFVCEETNPNGEIK